MKKRASATRGVSEALWEWNLVSNRIHFSPRWISLVGCDEHDVGNTPDEWLHRVHPQDSAELTRQLETARAGRGNDFEFRHRLRHKDGGYRWTACRIAVVRDEDGAATRLHGAHVDVTVETVTDTLTGLPNRLLVTDRLTQSIERAQKYEGFHYALLLLDLGGQTSTGVLTAAARRLETSLRIANSTPTLRSNDLVARIDGDRFAILLDGLKAVSHAKVVADRLLAEILSPLTVGTREVFLTASIGIAVSVTGYAQPDDVLGDAETALHRARMLGGSHSEVFDTAVLESDAAELQLEHDLKDALDRHEFRLQYQPIVSIASEQIIGFEALVRWHHPLLGVISPVDFIPIAERTEVIVALGDWILREACRRLKEWQDNPSLPTDLWISVNLSAVQLKDATLLERVTAALHESGLPARSLVLELTESMAMDNPTGVKSLLMQLRSIGVRISIDDFGTGYSSLAHLRQFPIDTLKIDRSFVRGIETREDSAAIVKTLAQMALQLGLHVVAEGIENEQQLALLRAVHCDAAQGYLFARPLDDAQATELLTSGVARPSTIPKPAVVGASWIRWAWAATAAVIVIGIGVRSFPRAAAEPIQPSDATLPAPNDAVRTPTLDERPAHTSIAPGTDSSPANRAPVTPSVAPPPPSSRPIRGRVPSHESASTSSTAAVTAPATPIAPVPTAASDTATVPRAAQSPATVTSFAVHVTHAHRIGHCEGRLVASGTGLAFIPDSGTSKDGFDMKYSEFVHLLQDDTLTVKSNTKTYRFKATAGASSEPTLAELESRMAHVR